jgi:AraC-like DNA-binding protein
MGLSHSLVFAMILASAFQGLICALMLFRSAAQHPENRFLGAMILLLALASFNMFLLQQNWTTGWQKVGDVLPLVIFMPVGPLFFFYVKKSLWPDFRFRVKNRFHFAPVVLDLFPYMLALAYHLGLAGNNKTATFTFIDSYNAYIDFPRWLSISIYLLLSWKLVRQDYKSCSVVRIKNLRKFVIAMTAFQTIWLIFLVPYLLPGIGLVFPLTLGWSFVYLPMAVVIYWLGIKAYSLSIQPHLPAALKISGMQLDAEVTGHAINQLKQAMDKDQLFLNPVLNLQMVITHTGLSQKVISHVLNHNLHKSFNEFVNEYRINAFKQMLEISAIEQFTLGGIAMQCGFNSQATFQRTFKQFTGVTPTAYLQAQASINRKSIAQI